MICLKRFACGLIQWAKIILVVEQTVTTESRHKQQLTYSQPIPGDRRALVIRWHQTVRASTLYVCVCVGGGVDSWIDGQTDHA